MTSNGERVIGLLTAWKSTQSWGAELAVPYSKSPAWNKMPQKVWAEYDRLLREQQSLGLARLDWQDGVEESRRRLKTNTAALSDRLSHLKPLWLSLRQYLGLEDWNWGRFRFAWRSAASDWQEFRRLYREDDGFVRSLSQTQRRSYLLIETWWTAAYCDEAFITATEAFIARLAPFETFNNPLGAEQHGNPETMTDSSTYHASCFRLFLVEFHSGTWNLDTTKFLMPLQQCRRNAYLATLAQKMAYALLRPLAAKGQPDQPYPKRIRGYNAQALSEDEETGTATIRPYYLWDTTAHKTIEAESLSEHPPYVCVSHTWGRWRTRTNTEVPGVPWHVPENTLYRVQDLPAWLTQLDTRYVWLDLFCIPQDRSERSQLEIAKQGSIFRGSQRCIAWLHDVEWWDGVASALDWMCLTYLHVGSRRDQEAVNQRFPAVTAAATRPTWLLKSLDSLVPSHWFSSLWTLQECFLCPDLELYSRRWQRLEDRRGVAIPLRSLLEMITVGLLQAKIRANAQPSLNANRPDDQVPSGVHELTLLLTATWLHDVLSEGSLVDFLMVSHLRQCSSRNRAPAIMSALGATLWYKEGINSQGREQGGALVLDMYPVEFLREAAAKLGPTFYSALYSVDPRTEIQGLSLGAFLEGQTRGTMLPIARRTGHWAGQRLSTPGGLTFDMETHTSLSTWRINDDGGVSIPSVGLALTSEDKPGTKHPGVVEFGFDATSNQTGRKKDVVDDVLAILKSVVWGGRRLYAVVLYKACGRLDGVVLEDMPQPWVDKLFLRKIGTFQIWEGAVMPPTTHVDWEVL